MKRIHLNLRGDIPLSIRYGNILSQDTKSNALLRSMAPAKTGLPALLKCSTTLETAQEHIVVLLLA